MRVSPGWTGTVARRHSKLLVLDKTTSRTLIIDQWSAEGGSQRVPRKQRGFRSERPWSCLGRAQINGGHPIASTAWCRVAVPGDQSVQPPSATSTPRSYHPSIFRKSRGLVAKRLSPRCSALWRRLFLLRGRSRGTLPMCCLIQSSAMQTS